MGRKPDLLDELNAAAPSQQTAILRNAAERRRQRFWFNGYFTGALGYAVLPCILGPGDPSSTVLRIVLGAMLAWLPGVVMLGTATLLWPMFFGALDRIDDFLKPWLTARSEQNLR